MSMRGFTLEMRVLVESGFPSVRKIPDFWHPGASSRAPGASPFRIDYLNRGVPRSPLTMLKMKDSPSKKGRDSAYWKAALPIALFMICGLVSARAELKTDYHPKLDAHASSL